MRKPITLAGLILAIAVVAPASALGETKGTERPLKFSLSVTRRRQLGNVHQPLCRDGDRVPRREGHHRRKWLVQNSAGSTPSHTKDSWVFTAANGDNVFGTSTGTVTGGPEGLLSSSEVALVLTITGGTGRFQNASGTLTGTYHQAAISSGEGTVTFSEQGSGAGSASY